MHIFTALSEPVGGLSLSVGFVMPLPSACISSVLVLIIVYLHIFKGLVYREQLPLVHNANAFLDRRPSSALNEADVPGKNSM